MKTQKTWMCGLALAMVGSLVGCKDVGSPKAVARSAAQALQKDDTAEFREMLTASAKAEYSQPEKLSLLKSFFSGSELHYRKAKLTGRTVLDAEHETRSYELPVERAWRHGNQKMMHPAAKLFITCQLGAGPWMEIQGIDREFQNPPVLTPDGLVYAPVEIDLRSDAPRDRPVPTTCKIARIHLYR